MTDKHSKQPLSKPDPETLHTTDPQEHMEGPVSSSMQGIRENAEENDHPQKQDKARGTQRDTPREEE